MLIAVGLVVLLAGAAFVVSRMIGGRGAAAAGLEQTRPVTVTGAALAPLGSGPDPAVGAPLPELRGASFDGRPLVIGPDGKPKVILVLAHWCPHCQREVPQVLGFLREGRLPAGVTLYSVASGTMADRPNYPPSAWLEREGWTVPVLADDAKGTAGAALGLTGYPFFVFVDPQGKVVARRSGGIPMSELQQLAGALRAS